ncbi:MAG: T9SS type A sorting domain-containing protein [Lewinella sp.]|nr:T9SS type A sorting domain-containing protein [Lewinella sp.]
MSKLLGLALPALLWLSCNKVVDEVPLPPFATYPNPFTDVFLIHLDHAIPAAADVDVRVLDGTDQPLVSLEDVDPNGVLTILLDQAEAGIYYVEVSIDGERFIEPILKAR